MASKFVPVTLACIEEGAFIGAVDEEFHRVQAALCAYLRKHGERAKGAAAVLTLKVTCRIENPDGESVSIKTAIASALPARPARATLAFVADTDNGPTLFARSAGTDAHAEPRQQKLVTDDGRLIDPDTGEVMGDALPRSSETGEHPDA